MDKVTIDHVFLLTLLKSPTFYYPAIASYLPIILVWWSGPIWYPITKRLSLTQVKKTVEAHRVARRRGFHVY
jgi:hypothetical protein